MPYNKTNRDNLPAVFVEAVKLDTHFVDGDLSVTQLLSPPKIRWLLQRNTVDLDVSDQLQMLFGTAMHVVLERAEIEAYGARALIESAVQLDRLGGEENGAIAMELREKARECFPEAFNDDILIENTLTITLPTSFGPLKLSGTVDKIIVSKKKIEDYKNTTVYNYMIEENKKKWYAQLNIYAAMCRENGIPIETASVMAFFKDYKNMAKLSNRDYPKSIAMEVPMIMWPHDKVMDNLIRKAEIHMAAMITDDYKQVPDCTKTDRWYDKDHWIALIPGQKRSKRKLPEEHMIDTWISDNILKYPKLVKKYVVGVNKRCEGYCPVADVCPQRKAWNERYNVETKK